MASHQYFADMTLFTDRLRLSTVRLEDTPEIFAEFRGNVVEYQDVLPCKTEEEQRGWVEQIIVDARAGRAVPLVVFDKRTDAFLGRCVLKKTDTATPEVGIWIKESEQGKGYAEEAMRCVLAWAEEHLSYTYIIAFIHTQNNRSIHLIEKLGGVQEKEFTMTTEERGKLPVYEYRFPRNQ